MVEWSGHPVDDSEQAQDGLRSACWKSSGAALQAELQQIAVDAEQVWARRSTPKAKASMA
jgi:hypothetical protein